ncbi:tetraspanin-2-like [Sinocyclocheilus grahami]|uniref:tetraspanin-2-like n=1 Tax=Sinocyclocheilus grahami TaxID=75366 RepID=UPI0007AD44D0|nr:PREDICTED: tetraspanin-2-like [Sinocyclocheilus grahami]
MSKVQGGMKCVKYLLFVFNFIFWPALLYSLKPASAYSRLGCLNCCYALYILIGAGGVMMLVGFFGCFGAVRESQCLLGSFFACLLVIFGAEVAAGVFGFLNKDKIIQDVQKYYQSAMENGNGTAITSMYHKMFECCGTESSHPPDLCTDDSPDTIIGMIFSMVLCCAIRNSREII